MCEEESVHYLRDLCREKEVLEKSDSTATTDITVRLLSQEISRVQNGGRPPGRETRLLDVYNERPVRVSAKVLVPVKEHPKFNFVGKLLGPRGNSLKKLQEDTMTKMAVLGRGSMRNKENEEELRKSGDPKHNHLHEDLHVEITAFASPAEAYARIAMALTEVRKYLIPDGNDEIRQKQMKEIQEMKLMEEKHSEDSGQESDVSNSPSSDPSPCNGGSATSPSASAASTTSSPAPSPPSHVLDNGRHYDHKRQRSILDKIRQTRADCGASGHINVSRGAHHPPAHAASSAGTCSSSGGLYGQQSGGGRLGPAAPPPPPAHSPSGLLLDYTDCGLYSKSILDRLLPAHLKERLKRDFESVMMSSGGHHNGIANPAHQQLLLGTDEPPWKRIK